MSSKKFSWKKLLTATVWLLVSSAAVVLLIAATRNQNGKLCKEVVVNIKGANAVGYVSKQHILKTISGGRPDLMPGQLIKTFDLQQLEKLLERNLWIRNAELFFDNNDVLHVDVTEREPVARVFRADGESFYIDELGDELPITNDQVARVPVFTSFPNETTVARIKDSVLKQQVKEIGQFILKDEFWMAQIDQVNINNYEFELMPKLGNHIIQFGSAEKIQPKFDRLLLFYKKIMQKTGWNYYSTLDLRYDRQLVALRRDSVSLFKSFVVEQNTYHVNTSVDTSYLQPDSSFQLNVNDSLLTSGPYSGEPTPVQPVLKSVALKPKPNESRNAMKNQLPTPKGKIPTPKSNEQKPGPMSEEEAVLNEVKSQPVKKQPKAVMKKKENE